MTKLKAKKFISIVFFLLGLGLTLYPQISKAFYDSYYRLEVGQLKDEIRYNQTAEMEEIYQMQLAYNKRKITNLNEIEIANVGVVEDGGADGEDIDIYEEGLIGIISIPKIDLTYAIRDGASDTNLAKSVARLEGTNYPLGGLDTNSVIAGHRGWAEKTFFSRIKELEKGDLIEIENLKEILYYKVFTKEVIEATNISALAPVPGQDMLTLLTCTGPTNAQRLLVFSKRTEAPYKDSAEDRKDKSGLTKSDDSDEISNTNNTNSAFLYSGLVLRRYGAIIGMLVLGFITFFFIYFRADN